MVAVVGGNKATFELSRGGVLAHRAVVQDLAAPVRNVADSQTLGLGLQNTPPGSALVGINARVDQSPQKVAGLLDAGGPLVLAMTARGAPHVTSRSELSLSTAAFYPLDEQEAAEVDEVALAMREIARGEAISRPTLSERLNVKVSDAVRDWCERCNSRHVREGLFRKATLQAGLELDPRSASPTMFRATGARPPARRDRDRARAELFRRYIHLTGVARSADLAAWLGYQTGTVRATWDLIADELTACKVAGKRRWALSSDLESLANARSPGGAKLLPRSDPYLLGDRALLVPEADHQRTLWRAQAGPGAIFAKGEIVGTWRHRLSGGRLQVTLHPFYELEPAVKKVLAREAEDVGVLRGVREVAVSPTV